MTTLQIDTNDTKKIEEFLALAISKFDFKIKVADVGERKSGISSYIDQKIKNSKSKNSKKSEQFNEAIDGLSGMMDTEKATLSLEQAKEQYFSAKAN